MLLVALIAIPAAIHASNGGDRQYSEEYSFASNMLHSFVTTNGEIEFSIFVDGDSDLDANFFFSIIDMMEILSKKNFESLEEERAMQEQLFAHALHRNVYHQHEI